MGLVDAFGAEKCVELKVSELFNLFKGMSKAIAQNEIMLNGYKNKIDHDTVLVLLGEESEEK